MNFRNARIYTRDAAFVNGNFSVENGLFTNVLGEAAPDAIDLHGATVIPGLIDIHTHGNSGCDFSDGNYEGLRMMAKYYAECGVTSFAPASLTISREFLAAAYRNAGRLAVEPAWDEAALRGINMEGPFFSESRKGAQNPEYLRLPDYDLFAELNEISGGLVKIADVAPELPGAMEFIEKASRVCTVSVAHTDADYDTARLAFDAGARQLTHLFNAMNPLHHRKPGPIAAAVENPAVKAELICDGLHVHPSMVRLAFSLFGAERIILVSDSLRCCGLPDGPIDAGGQTAYLENGIARLEDGTIAGSAVNLFQCLQRAVSFGIPAEDAVRAASFNPAAAIGCLDRVGSIENGKIADFIVTDPLFTDKTVYLRGNRLPG